MTQRGHANDAEALSISRHLEEKKKKKHQNAAPQAVCRAMLGAQLGWKALEQPHGPPCFSTLPEAASRTQTLAHKPAAYSYEMMADC